MNHPCNPLNISLFKSRSLVGIRSVADYSPFGVELDGRTQSGGGYRYSFQGQEKDDEIKGEGNSINYKYRMHDPRVGRFFAVDPLAPKYPWYTPYQFSGNKLIHMVELEGLEEAKPNTIDEKIKRSQLGLEYTEADLPQDEEVPNQETPKLPERPSMSAINDMEWRSRENQRELNAINERLDYLHSLPGMSMGIGVGGGLMYGPEAASYVILPELLGPRVAGYLYKANSFLGKINAAERTLNVGMNMLHQKIASPNIGVGEIDQVSAATAFFTPLKMSFSRSLLLGASSGMVTYTHNNGVNFFGSPNAVDRIGNQTLTSLNGIMKNSMNFPLIRPIRNHFGSQLFNTGFTGFVQFNINSINEH